MLVGLPLGVAKTLVQIAERVKKEKYDGKRRYSEFFGEVVVSAKSMRLDSIPGLLSQEYKSNQDEEIEDDEEKDIDVEFLPMNDFPPLMHPHPSSKIIMVRPCYKVIYDQLLDFVKNESPQTLQSLVTLELESQDSISTASIVLSKMGPMEEILSLTLEIIFIAIISKRENLENLI